MMLTFWIHIDKSQVNLSFFSNFLPENQLPDKICRQEFILSVSSCFLVDKIQLIKTTTQCIEVIKVEVNNFQT